MADLISYVKSDEVRLVRRTHRFGISTMHTVSDLIEMLKRLPKHATVDEWINWEEQGVLTIQFHEETRKD